MPWHTTRTDESRAVAGRRAAQTQEKTHAQEALRKLIAQWSRHAMARGPARKGFCNVTHRRRALPAPARHEAEQGRAGDSTARHAATHHRSAPAPLLTHAFSPTPSARRTKHGEVKSLRFGCPFRRGEKKGSRIQKNPAASSNTSRFSSFKLFQKGERGERREGEGETKEARRGT